MAPKKKMKTKRVLKKILKKPVGKRSSFDGVDIATEEDLPRLDELLKENVVLIALIHADWCGHCQTFKPLWEDYKNIPGRHVPMVSINEKILSKTPFKDAKLNGFPSTVVYSGKDGQFGSFKDENGEDTNSVPNARDKNVMMKLLQAKPDNIMLNNVELENETETVQPTEEADKLLEKSGKRAIKYKDIPMINLNDAKPPNIAVDNMKRRPYRTKRRRRN